MGGQIYFIHYYILSNPLCLEYVKSTIFVEARTWKQPRCPSADEWIGKLWYIYTMEYYSAIKKNTFESVLMRWMKLEPIIQGEVSEVRKKKTNTVCCCCCCSWVASVVSDSVWPQRWQTTRLPFSPGKNTGVGCHFLLQCMKVKSKSEVAQSCPTPSDPIDWSLSGFSIHGICQARVLELVAIAFSPIQYTNAYIWT